MSKETDRAHILLPPPVLAVLLLGLGMFLDHKCGLGILPAEYSRPSGMLVLILSGLLGLSGLVALRRARTCVNPYSSTSALVSSGPYSLSRNPLYLSLLGLYLGAALCLSSVWSLILFPFLWAGLHYGVVLPEERYLNSKFGDDFRDYARKTPRWL